jgi:hypothetical protein
MKIRTQLGSKVIEHERILKLLMQIANEARLLKEKGYCYGHCKYELEQIEKAAQLAIDMFVENSQV